MSTVAIVADLVFDAIGAAFLILMFYLLSRVTDPTRGRGTVTALAAAVVSLFFGNLDRIDSMGVSWNGGFQAKTREFQGVIDNARATVASLQGLAMATAELQVDMLASEGRLGGESTNHKDGLKDALLARLKALGLSTDQLAEVDRADSPWVRWDYTVALLKPLNARDAKDPKEGVAYSRVLNAGEPLTPDECATLLKQFNLQDMWTNELLEDYRYYFESGKQRRPDVWRNRANWP